VVPAHLSDTGAREIEMSKDTKTPTREVLAALLVVKREVQETRREEARPVTSGPLPGDD
jgi:hypothetical protein